MEFYLFMFNLRADPGESCKYAAVCCVSKRISLWSQISVHIFTMKNFISIILTGEKPRTVYCVTG